MEHILGPKLSVDPRLAVSDAHKKEAASLGVSMRLPFFVTADAVTVVVDRKASLVASDARKLVDAFAKARATLKDPRKQAVILLAHEQKLCSKTDNAQRARPLLQAGNVAVYRMPPTE